ncbi:MAG: NAD(P)-binding domain-containing protein [Chloroflexota bacterium]|nr:NAD(P)-binding domain-containing protein [Chloroflexota bacterium]
MQENENTRKSEAEVAIVGAGPIGIELAACLKRAGVDYVHIEAKQIGDTISWWPRNTTFFSTTERIEIAGIPIQNPAQQRTTGEEYLVYLRSVIEQLDLQVNAYEPLINIESRASGFKLTTRPASGERHWSCRKLVLATGDMHGPNRLGIPGEDLPHVSHYFHDVHPYFRQRLLIVGGRNSAVEAALRCWRAGAEVAISYRRPSFNSKIIKHWILPDLETQIDLGNIAFHESTIPVEITPRDVVLAQVDEGLQPSGEYLSQPADFVLLLTGFEADMSLFETAGIELEGPEQTPLYNPETMETNVPGLYLAGTAAAGRRQEKYRLFIENTHVHVGRIVQELTGSWPEDLGAVPKRSYELPLEAIQAN